MKNYQLLGVRLQTMPEHTAKAVLQTFLNSDSQHQIVTVNPEFIVACQKNKKFLDVINQASLATVDGAGIVKALQFLGSDISMDDRLTGVQLTNHLIHLALNKNYKIIFCLYSQGLTDVNLLFSKIKDDYPSLDFQIADEHNCVSKAQSFAPAIVLVGLGAPYQDLWIYEHLSKMPTVKIAIGVGGTFDFLSGQVRRAPKFLRSYGLEWFWRLLHQPNRWRRIYRAIIVFPGLVIKSRFNQYLKRQLTH